METIALIPTEMEQAFTHNACSFYDTQQVCVRLAKNLIF